MKDPIFTKKQVLWLQDRVINKLVAAHYVLDMALEDKKVEIRIVKAAYKDLMLLVDTMRKLKYE